MNAIAGRAEAILNAHAHPALRMFELLDILAADVDRTLTEGRLRAILEDHPERFRVLESWKDSRRPDRRSDEEVEPAAAWVVAVGAAEMTPEHAAPPVLRLRESVRWLGQRLDGRSRVDVSRWYAIALAERATRTALLRKAA